MQIDKAMGIRNQQDKIQLGRSPQVQLYANLRETTSIR